MFSEIIIVPCKKVLLSPICPCQKERNQNHQNLFFHVTKIRPLTKGDDQQKQQLKSLHQEKVQKQKKADRVDSKEEEDKKTQQQFEDTEKDKQKAYR